MRVFDVAVSSFVTLGVAARRTIYTSTEVLLKHLKLPRDRCPECGRLSRDLCGVFF